MENALISRDITKTFGEDNQILKGISLEIEAGSFTVLLGQSGSGKTTLLNVLSGLMQPTSGAVYCGANELTAMTKNQVADWKRRHGGNIFQNYLLLSHLNVKENIELGIAPDSEPLNLEHLAKILDINTVLHQFPAQLSGGQQQRVAIARGVIKRPDILFCDEVTGALDEINSKRVVSLLLHLKQTYGITILFATHNLQIAETADRVITIKDGVVAKDCRNQKPIDAEQMTWV